MLSRVLGPERLRHLAGVIIFGMLSAAMVHKAFITPAPIDRAESVSGTLETVEPLVRSIKGKDTIKSLRLRIAGDTRGFLIYPGVFAHVFDHDAFVKEVPLGTPIHMQVRPERLPVIYALSTAKKTYISKADTRAHLNGRTTFLRIAAVAPILVTIFCLFQLVRRRPEEQSNA